MKSGKNIVLALKLILKGNIGISFNTDEDMVAYIQLLFLEYDDMLICLFFAIITKYEKNESEI